MIKTNNCPADGKSVCSELQAYRDTGMSPEEIIELKKKINEVKKLTQ